jgi:hypothetical protein
MTDLPTPVSPESKTFFLPPSSLSNRYLYFTVSLVGTNILKYGTSASYLYSVISSVQFLNYFILKSIK